MGEQLGIAVVQTCRQFCSCHLPASIIIPEVSDVTTAIGGESEDVGDDCGVEAEHFSDLIHPEQSPCATCCRRIAAHREETACGDAWGPLYGDLSS
jgi:hypothetical protein